MLVCPALLAMDERHGIHRENWPKRLGSPHPWDNRKHEEFLHDPEGHRVDVFVWGPGARPPEPDEHPRCDCGELLVWSDLDNLYDERHLAPAEGGSDGA
jgi:hypothetical protein